MERTAKNVVNEIRIRLDSNTDPFHNFFSYETKFIKKQTILSKGNPFMKILIPTNNSKITQLSKMRFEFIEYSLNHLNGLILSLNNEFYSEVHSVVKSTETYLENPYKSQCSYYDKSEAPFGSVSHKDCYHKCLRDNCYVKHYCFYKSDVIIIRKLDKLPKVYLKCNEHKNNDCFNAQAGLKCRAICPIDCFKEEFYLKKYYRIDEQNETNVYFYWASDQLFILYEETPNILLLDYFTYIGGLFGLWFGICLENLFDLIVKHTTILKPKIKIQFKKLLSFIHLILIYFLNWIHDLIMYFMNYVNSLMHKIRQFKEWFCDCFEILMDLIVIRAKILRLKLKLFVNTIFSFILLWFKLIFVYFLKCIFVLITILKNFLLKRSLSIQNRIEPFSP
jgi:hypothetical protein